MNGSIPEPRPERTELLLVFRLDDPEQAEALHTFRAAFASATSLKAVSEHMMALTIWPGRCACGEAVA